MPAPSAKIAPIADAPHDQPEVARQAETARGMMEFAQAWLSAQARMPVLQTSRERFFKDSDGAQH